MFAQTEAYSGFSVTDVAQAEAFYRDVLGLKTSIEHGMLTLHLTGDRPTLVYPKSDHEPASYTVLNFPVPDVEEAVDALVARGVEFVRYPGIPQDDKGIMRGHGPDIAWFTDPSGNVLSVIAEG
jgi:catechol 2,3-dioxygenase-like lactoylglutathione lyase family enzyme